MTPRDIIPPLLKREFPALAIDVPDASEELIAVIAPRHPEVGAVTIEEDGPDVIVTIGTITHGHFGYWNDDLSEEERAHSIADNVISFLHDLFDDRVLLSRYGPLAGGWRIFPPGERPTPGRSGEHYLWSGPLPSAC